MNARQATSSSGNIYRIPREERSRFHRETQSWKPPPKPLYPGGATSKGSKKRRLQRKRAEARAKDADATVGGTKRPLEAVEDAEATPTGGSMPELPPALAGLSPAFSKAAPGTPQKPGVQ